MISKNKAMTIYKPSFTFQSTRWRQGEWGNRNALGKILLLPAICVLFVVIIITGAVGLVMKEEK